MGFVKFCLGAALLLSTGLTGAKPLVIKEYPVPSGSQPHDVAPAANGGVWYTAQRAGALGWLDPKTGKTRLIELGQGSSPHGVIVGPDGAPWITDSGLNAIVRVDPANSKVRVFTLPADTPNINLNTATFDRQGVLWFTGQAGFYGRLDPASADVEVFTSPRGHGPYGICFAPDGSIYYASLAGSHIAHIAPLTERASIIEPPTPHQGARRVWADSASRIWVSEWNSGQVSVYDPKKSSWRSWRLPGNKPQPYAVYVDDKDIVWLSDFASNAIVRFDPTSEQFTVIELPSRDSQVRQIMGRPGEIWLPLSGVDKLGVIHTGN